MCSVTPFKQYEMLFLQIDCSLQKTADRFLLTALMMTITVTKAANRFFSCGVKDEAGIELKIYLMMFVSCSPKAD